MPSLLTSQPVLSSLDFQPVSFPRTRYHPDLAPQQIAFLFADKHSYRALMILQSLGGEHCRFDAAALLPAEIDRLSQCDFILVDASNMSPAEIQETIGCVRSATLAPLVILAAGEPAHEMLQSGADAVVAFSESLDVSVARCKAVFRRCHNRQRYDFPPRRGR